MLMFIDSQHAKFKFSHAIAILIVIIPVAIAATDESKIRQYSYNIEENDWSSNGRWAGTTNDKRALVTTNVDLVLLETINSENIIAEIPANSTIKIKKDILAGWWEAEFKGKIGWIQTDLVE